MVNAARAPVPRVARLVIATAVLFVIAAGTAGAQIRYPYLPAMEALPDARSMGLGRAYTAIAEGPSAVWWNPGALGLPRPWEAMLFTDVDLRPFLGGDVDAYAVSGPVRGIGVGLHLVRVGEGDYGSATRTSDFLLQGGAGVDLTEPLRLGDTERMHLGAGASLKLYRMAFRDDRDPDGAYREHPMEWDLDAGALFAARLPLRSEGSAPLFPRGGAPRQAFAGLRAGVVVRNALSHEIDLTESRDGEWPLGVDVRSGIALEAGSDPLGPFGAAIAGTCSAELAGALEDQDRDPMRSFGLELRLLDLLSFRYGEIRDNGFEGVTRGLGLHVGLPGRAGVRVDWADVPFPCCGEDAKQVSASLWYVL